MCIHHLESPPAEITPLFRHDHNMEITYGESPKRLKDCLIAAGFAELAMGTPSLRVGGFTLYLSSTNRGEDVCRALGKWSSSARWLYVLATSERV